MKEEGKVMLVRKNIRDGNEKNCISCVRESKMSVSGAEWEARQSDALDWKRGRDRRSDDVA